MVRTGEGFLLIHFRYHLTAALYHKALIMLQINLLSFRMCNLLKRQSARDIDIDEFDNNPYK